MKQSKRENIRSLLEIKREKDEDTTHLIQRAPQIPSWNHQNLILILTHLCLRHLMLVQAMTDVREERSLPEKISTGVESGRTNGVIKSGVGVARDLSAKQEGLYAQNQSIILKCLFFFFFFFFFLWHL